MKGKILFVTGAAIGYVLGARAGRRRYEQIRAAAAKVWETPGIQNQVQQVQDFAAEKVGEIPDALIEGAKKVVTSVVKRQPKDARAAEGSSSSTATAKPAAAPKTAGTAKKPASKKPGTAKRPAASKKPATDDSTE